MGPESKVVAIQDNSMQEALKHDVADIDVINDVRQENNSVGATHQDKSRFAWLSAVDSVDLPRAEDPFAFVGTQIPEVSENDVVAIVDEITKDKLYLPQQLSAMDATVDIPLAEDPFAFAAGDRIPDAPDASRFAW